MLRRGERVEEIRADPVEGTVRLEGFRADMVLVCLKQTVTDHASGNASSVSCQGMSCRSGNGSHELSGHRRFR